MKSFVTTLPEFEQTVPIEFQNSKQKWKTEQYKQWFINGCLGVH